jgi:5-hydroxyisourate hydrolase-like protein (transthyretin family)
MKRKVFAGVAIVGFLALPVPASMVRGTISDSATGAPIGNVKVVFYQVIGERSELLDSSVTGADGGYAFAGPASPAGPITGSGLYIYTINNEYYFHSTEVYLRNSIDTVTYDIRLRRISTGAEIFSRIKSRDKAIGIAGDRPGGTSAHVVADLYFLNGCRLPGSFMPPLVSQSLPHRFTGAAMMIVRRSGNSAECRAVVSYGGYRP